jgi:hypothetical protein
VTAGRAALAIREADRRKLAFYERDRGAADVRVTVRP